MIRIITLWFFLLFNFFFQVKAQIPALNSSEFVIVPPGYQWAISTDMSDEFNNQTLLNTTKWHPRLPNWAGRKPAEFLPENIVVEDGMLLIKNTIHPAPHDGFTIAGGGIESKASQKYGFFEVKMKASKIRMSSTFWLNTNRVWDDPNVNSPDRPDCEGYSTEIDIIECMGGGSPDWAAIPWDKGMASNTHFKLKRIKDTNCSSLFLSRGNAAFVTNDQANVADDFHVYGAWWVTPNLVHYFIDGVYKYSVNPRDDNFSTPFNVPMTVRMVTETYDWQIKSDGTPNPGYPNETELNDASINTTYYDWVRSYELKQTLDNLVVDGDMSSGTLTAPWTSWTNGGSISFTKEKGEKYSGDYGARIEGPGGLEQAFTVVPGTEYVYTAMAKKSLGSSEIKLGVKPVSGGPDLVPQLKVTSTDYEIYELRFNSGSNTQIKIYAAGISGDLGFVDNVSLIQDETLGGIDELNDVKKNVTITNNKRSIGIFSESSTELEVSISIYSILGREVYKQEDFTITNSVQYVPMQVDSGMYIIKITSEKGEALVKKVVF
ncbi:family 16 glycosylhydrolase [Aquimarina agarilytica]|uniref:family 16 glycosylhydrolase n=1 Tax=Aquimarina agarilytica TaxID=1087449 RepID=UPI0002893490|nr:family 16 glycosylhydrolase [Aquimarina agarilytica]